MLKFILLLLLFTITGCENDVVYTINNSSNKIFISYPETNVSKLDDEIYSLVDEHYKLYISLDKGTFFANELNISYDYQICDNVHIIKLYFEMTVNSIKTIKSENIIYNKENNQFIDNYNICLNTTEDMHLSIEKTFVDNNKKLVAITFDDGPSDFTKSIIELLNEYNAKATFFVVGNKVNSYQSLLKEMIESGHEIGNHSYDHKWLTRLSQKELSNQIDKVQDLFFTTYNYEIKYLRPTYGAINNFVRNNTDLEIIMWTVDSSDWKIKDSNILFNNMIQEVEENDIVLFHDTYESTYETLKKLIPYLTEEGYQFVTISQLMNAY